MVQCSVSAFAVIAARIREQGSITLAEYMETALYDPDHGYYSVAEQRSGRAGDFFTNVDVGPLFGELLAVQFEEMWRLLGAPPRIDLVEAGAGNGRLSRDVLDAAKREYPAFYAATQLWIAERSPLARSAAIDTTLAAHAVRVAGAGPDLPGSVTGIIFANELLDAMPAHAVVMTPGGLREIHVTLREDCLVETEGPLSDPAIARHLADSGATLAAGARAHVSLAATRWVENAGRALVRGFLVLVDYGRPGAELYSPAHHGGTLMAYRSHTAGSSQWLEHPGRQDLTTHVDLTAVRRAAEAAGLRTLGAVDQTYFVTALGLAHRLEGADDRQSLKKRLAARTLMTPGGLGSTMKIMVFARHDAAQLLTGLAAGRLT